MKNTAFLIAAIFSLAGAAFAQVTVQIIMPQDQFLPGETIPVCIRLVNNSGQTLHFGDDNWLSYTVESHDGVTVVKGEGSPTRHGFEIRPAEEITTRANLAPMFAVNETGRYTLTANVHIQDWNKDAASSGKTFDAVNGTKFWEQEFGVPQSATNHSEPEVRKYTLQTATLMKHMNLYLKLTDLSGSRLYRVQNLGEMISFSNPQTRLDAGNNLHLLYQEASHTYRYMVINPDGNTKLRQTYNYTTSAPHFKLDESGNPIIVGGIRHLADNDIPFIRKAALTNDASSRIP